MTRTLVGTARERPRLILATENPGKVAELVDLLGEHFAVEPRPTDLAETVEDQDSLAGNAHKKADEVRSHTGQAALADDTGLFVPALNWRPGVYSARYAGPEADGEANQAKLLTEMEEASDRRAYFETIIALGFGRSIPDWPTLPEPIRRGVWVLAWGRVDGTITTEPRGSGGFGYDPIFVPDEGDGRTFAEMSRAEKGAISHRGRALADLGCILGLRFGPTTEPD